MVPFACIVVESTSEIKRLGVDDAPGMKNSESGRIVWKNIFQMEERELRVCVTLTFFLRFGVHMYFRTPRDPGSVRVSWSGVMWRK